MPIKDIINIRIILYKKEKICNYKIFKFKKNKNNKCENFENKQLISINPNNEFELNKSNEFNEFNKFDEENTKNNNYLENELEIDQRSNYSDSSGAGYPILLESRISNQIKIEKLLGTGKFGQIFYGKWKNHPVAVKIFLDNDAAKHEAALYYNYHLRHENVLCFISVDNFNLTGPCQYWLIFDYHPNLSLYDFIHTPEKFYNVSNDEQIQKLGNILISMCAGLKYLHSEIVGHGIFKPRIAHRDIKSQNILIKCDGMCCIADLGMSIVEDNFICQKEYFDNDSKSYSPYFENNHTENHFLTNSHSSQPNQLHSAASIKSDIKMSPTIINNKVVGTKRYMAPEIISFSMNREKYNKFGTCFNSYLKTDIYSLGLVIWEILRCFTFNIKSNSFYSVKEPYFEYLYEHPSIKEIYPIVCQQKLRPTMCLEWENSQLSQLIQICWHDNPDARPRIFYIHQKLQQIFSNPKLEFTISSINDN